jgi:hypothetical protein
MAAMAAEILEGWIQFPFVGVVTVTLTLEGVIASLTLVYKKRVISDTNWLIV